MNESIATRYQALIERQEAIEAEIMGTKKPSITKSEQYRSAYTGFLRSGRPMDSLTKGTDGSGGYLVPDVLEKLLIESLEEENVLRKISKVLQTRYDLKIPGVINHGHATWVDEEGGIEESSEEFGQLVLRAFKISTMMKVSDELLEDSGFDIEKHIAKSFALRIGSLEEQTFLTGDGVAKPYGLLHDVQIAAETSEVGRVGIDDLIDLMHGVNFSYRENGVWLMNDHTCREIYKIKSGRGRNLWESSLKEDEPTKLLGKPVIICKSMPDIELGSKPILFGDFSHYWIGDRGNRSIKRLNELYSQTGQVGFVASQRVDAKLVQPKAIKCLHVQA